MIGPFGSTSDPRSVVVVGNESARSIADHLDDEYDVIFLSGDAQVVRAAESSSVDAHRTDPRTAEDLREYAAGADAAVVVAERDRVTLLAAQLLRNACGIDSVVVQVNDPTNRKLFEDLGIETLNSRRLLGTEVERSLAAANDR